jgi:hypothetical protein
VGTVARAMSSGWHVADVAGGRNGSVRGGPGPRADAGRGGERWARSEEGRREVGES